MMQVGGLDRIKPAQHQGITEIVMKYGQKQYENYRNYLINATFEDLKKVGSEYLKDELKSRCVFGR